MPNVAAALDEPNDDSRRVPFSPKGCVGSYIHAGGKIGVLVELNCKSDFVARTDDLQELIKDIAMHIAAAEPKFIRREDVTSEAYEKEKDIYRAQAAGTGKAAGDSREDSGRQDGQVLRRGLPPGAALCERTRHYDRSINHPQRRQAG
jgi:hypothetical protein